MIFDLEIFFKDSCDILNSNSCSPRRYRSIRSIHHLFEFGFVIYYKFRHSTRRAYYDGNHSFDELLTHSPKKNYSIHDVTAHQTSPLCFTVVWILRIKYNINHSSTGIIVTLVLKVVNGAFHRHKFKRIFKPKYFKSELSHDLLERNVYPLIINLLVLNF